jgi:hypothetical protein
MDRSREGKVIPSLKRTNVITQSIYYCGIVIILPVRTSLLSCSHIVWPYGNSSINLTDMKFLWRPNKCTDVCVIYLVSGAFSLRDWHTFLCLVCKAAACVCIIKTWWEIKEHAFKTTDLKRQEESLQVLWDSIILLLSVWIESLTLILCGSRLLANYGHYNHCWSKAPRGFVVSA